MNVALPVAVVAPTKDCGRVILLPDDDCKVGRVYAKGEKAGEAKLEKAYEASQDDCDKVAPVQLNADDVNKQYGPLLSMLPPKARYYRINFVFDKDEMVPESEAVFKSLLEDYRKTGSPEVTIIGHADKVGNPAYNLRLSQRRAKAVFNTLTQDGAVKAASIEHAWRGDRDPLPGTEAANVEPRNRRVEVKIQ